MRGKNPSGMCDDFFLGETCILDRPRMIIERTFASCGSDECGQTGMEKPAAVAERFIFQIPSSLLSISCGPWCTILSFESDIIGFLGRGTQGDSVRTLEIRNSDAKKLVICDSFSITHLADNTLDTDNIRFPVDTALDIFGKFQMGAIITSEKRVVVAFKHEDGSSKAVNLELPDGEVPYFVEPHGPNGVCVLCTNGKLFVFENESSVHSHTFEKVVSVASTRGRTIFLESCGRIQELRHGRTIQVSGISGLPIKVFAGGAHFGCVTYDGECYTWGCGTSGQLGNGSFLNTAVPMRVIRPHDHKIEDASAGEEHTVFTLINRRNFSCILPKIMRNELLPAGCVATQLIPHSFTPPESDLKFW